MRRRSASGPAAPAMRGAPGAIAVRKKTSESGSSIAAAPSRPAATTRPAARAEPGQQQALDDELPGDAAAAGAERDADRHLAPPADRLRAEQVRQVDAGDEQHEPDRAEHDERRRAGRPRRRATRESDIAVAPPRPPVLPPAAMRVDLRGPWTRTAAAAASSETSALRRATSVIGVRLRALSSWLGSTTCRAAPRSRRRRSARENPRGSTPTIGVRRRR